MSIMCQECGQEEATKIFHSSDGSALNCCEECFDVLEDEFTPTGICEDCEEKPATNVSAGACVCDDCYARRYHLEN